jgi:hypothetical protein
MTVDPNQVRPGSGGLFGKLLGISVVVAGVLIYMQLPEIRRYLRMERM